MKQRQNSIDWAAAKVEYANDPTLTYSELAKRYGVTLSSVKIRASREDWTGARAARANLLLQSVTEKTVSAQAQELAKWNERDLEVAKALRNVVIHTLNTTQLRIKAKPGDSAVEAKNIRSLAGAAESAQRIARLALGASTENSMLGTPLDPLTADIDLESLSDDELVAFQQLLVKAISNARRRDEAPSGTTVQ
jgi:hypothetical protein